MPTPQGRYTGVEYSEFKTVLLYNIIHSVQVLCTCDERNRIVSITTAAVAKLEEACDAATLLIVSVFGIMGAAGPTAVGESELFNGDSKGPSATIMVASFSSTIVLVFGIMAAAGPAAGPADVGESELFDGNSKGSAATIMGASFSFTMADAHSSKPVYWSGVFCIAYTKN